MAENSLISWTDHTFNPWVGCAKVSPACDGCYAEHLMQNRMGRVVFGAPGKGAGTRERTSKANWRKPIAWDKAARVRRFATGLPTFVFCASLADVFDNEVPLEWRQDLFALIRATPDLTWLLLTKRPGQIERLWFKSDGSNPWPANAAIGATIVTQEEANRDVPKLLAAKSALRPAFAFLSMEPLLEAVDLRYPAALWPNGPPMCCDGSMCGCRGMPIDPPLAWGVDWVITGGETDQGPHKARPSHPQWFRDLRDQCEDLRVPFHHKQNGEWIGDDQAVPTYGQDWTVVLEDGTATGQVMFRVGKKRSGRTIDGVEHDARPVV